MLEKNKLLIIICSIFFTEYSIAQKDKSLCFEVSNSKSNSVESLISVKLDEESFKSIKNEMVLLKISEKGEKIVPFQIEKEQSKIWFKHKESEKTISYCLKKSDSLSNNEKFNFQRQNGVLKFDYNGQSLIGYRYKMKLPPIGVNKLYQKSGYIHPVISPKGDTLTRIQPPDHYHHYGVWGPWTKTKINNREVDFWNLKEGVFKRSDQSGLPPPQIGKAAAK